MQKRYNGAMETLMTECLHLGYLFDCIFATELFEVKAFNVCLGTLPAFAYSCSKKSLQALNIGQSAAQTLCILVCGFWLTSSCIMRENP